jgi:probable rRNA maturation factor
MATLEPKSLTIQSLEKWAQADLKRILAQIPKLKGLNVRTTGPLRVDVQCVSARKMSALNLKFRDKNQDTDVLSFEAPEVFQKAGFLGDLVLSKTKLLQQAKEFGHSPRVEMRVLLVHGVLHLLGFDHETSDQDAKRMARWEAKVLLEAFRLKRSAALVVRGHPLKMI